MVYVDIHDIIKIDSKIVKLEGCGSYVKRIEIETKNGTNFINLFSDIESNLKDLRLNKMKPRLKTKFEICEGCPITDKEACLIAFGSRECDKILMSQ